MSRTALHGHVDGGGRQSTGIHQDKHMHTRLAYPRPSESLASRREELRDLFQSAARNLVQFAATKQEHLDCHQVAAGKYLSFRALTTLCRLAARSETPFLIEDICRREAIASLTTPAACAFEASEAEQYAQAPLDQAQLLAAREDSAVRWIQVAELSAQEERAARILKDAAWRRAECVS